MGSIFKTDGVVERLSKACLQANKEPNGDAAHKVLEDAIHKEIKLIEAIKDMPMFAEWIQGQHFDLAKAKPRKT